MSQESQDRKPSPDKPADDPAVVPAPGLPLDSATHLPVVAPDKGARQIKQFVTQLKSAEVQVGEHIITALQDPSTVAVLTTVVLAPDGGQRIVSAGLDPELLEQVQTLLDKAEDQRDEEVPCIGFHCFVKRKDKGKESDAPAS